MYGERNPQGETCSRHSENQYLKLRTKYSNKSQKCQEKKLSIIIENKKSTKEDFEVWKVLYSPEKNC